MVALSATVLATAAAAQNKKTVVMAAGDCSDASLISGSRDFTQAVEPLLGAQLIEGSVVLDIVRPRPTRSVAELERQVDSARTLFYGGQADRAEELVDRSLDELERVSPEAKPWNATVAALVLKALIARGAEKNKDATEAFRRIVRIDPLFKLDPDAYPPSTVAAFEAVKKEVARARKVQVWVRAESGDASVFIDGHFMGPSPLRVELVPGNYRVVLSRASEVSFPHRLDVSAKEAKLNVDMAFEGAVGLVPPLCLSSGTDAVAVKLGQVVAAERVIVLRNVARRSEPPYLSGAVIDLASGQQVRDGSVQLKDFESLANFLVTGQESALVRKAGAAAPTPVETAKVPVAEPATSAAPLPPPTPPLVTAVQPGAPANMAMSGGRIFAITLLAAGVVSVVSGVGVFAAGSSARDDLASLTTGDRINGSQSATALALMDSVNGNGTAAGLLIGLGVGALGGGIVSMLVFPGTTVRVSASVTPGQGALLVRGSF